MIQIQWADRLLSSRQNVKLKVQRIVFRASDWAMVGPIVQRIADDAGIEIANEHATPTPGDFWLGCSPRLGWGEADPDTMGWACSVEVSLAISVLRAATYESRAAEIPNRFVAQPSRLLALHS